MEKMYNHLSAKINDKVLMLKVDFERDQETCDYFKITENDVPTVISLFGLKETQRLVKSSPNQLSEFMMVLAFGPQANEVEEGE